MRSDGEWLNAMLDKGHTPCREDGGGIDMWAYAEGDHNGPVCATCDCHAVSIARPQTTFPSAAAGATFARRATPTRRS